MANRLLFLILSSFLFVELSSASNLLKGLKVKNSILMLEFKRVIKKSDFKASAIKGEKLSRYFFDFKNTTLSKKVKRKILLSGDVKSVRVAQNRKNVVRVVIDSKKPYKIRYFQKDKPIFHIVLPKTKVLKGVKKVAKKEPVKNLFAAVNVDNSPKKVKAKIIETEYSANLKHSYKITIDAGHGGHDPGTTWHGYKEKVLVLQISKRVYRRLKALGFKVTLTRNSDKFIRLSRRTRKANRAKADLFVSIHANSVSSKRKARVARGIETYFLQTTRNARAKRVAAKENAEILKGKDSATKKVLLNAVFTGPKIALSNRLAIDVQKGMLGNLRAKYRGVRDNGVRGAPFYVLVGAEMPAILIEVGYLSNPKERKRLFNPTYQELLAKGIVEGIVRYLKNRERELE